MKKILIADKSTLVQKQIIKIIDTLNFEIDTAINAQEVVEKASNIQYDLIIIDINIIDAIKQIMHIKPTVILVMSSLCLENVTTIMDALDLGALDYIAKPGTMIAEKNDNCSDILTKVKYLSEISPKRLKRTIVMEQKKLQTQANSDISSLDIKKVILIGSSTGGVKLINEICKELPLNYKYPVCIVQHMPEEFTSTFTHRLDKISRLNVYETSQNMELLPGNIYIARGGVHMSFAKEESGKIYINENKIKGDSFFQPSINEMMNSALEVFDASELVGVILSGIGNDGADAMVRLKRDGAYTICESEDSASTYEMPSESYQRDGVVEQLSFDDILNKIITL
ncbi:chemotaxis protein CheB [Sulfurimonas sp.]